MGCDGGHLKTLELFQNWDSMRSRMAGGDVDDFTGHFDFLIMAPSGRLACVFTSKITHSPNQMLLIYITKNALGNPAVHSL